MPQPNTPTAMILGKDEFGNAAHIAVSNTGSTTLDGQANSLLALFETPRPLGVLGAYAIAYNNIAAGPMAAGLAANSPIFSFRWAPTGANANALALITRVGFALEELTAFTAGIGNIDLFVARGYSAVDTGGATVSLTTNQAKLRTSFGTSLVGTGMLASTTATLTAGTRTLDTRPLNTLMSGFAATANSLVIPNTDLLNRNVAAGNWPLVLATNEGIVLQATVPATGTWNFQVTIEWSEVSTY